MLLPGMQAGLGLAYDRMGSIATANFIGYLLAVRLTPALLSCLGPRPTITAALLLIALGMFGISRSQNFAAIAFLYTLVGIGTGFADIYGSAKAFYPAVQCYAGIRKWAVISPLP